MSQSDNDKTWPRGPFFNSAGRHASCLDTSRFFGSLSGNRGSAIRQSQSRPLRLFQTARSEDENDRIVSGRGQHPSIARGSHGIPFGANGSGGNYFRLGFDQALKGSSEKAAGAYLWWYLDAFSQCGEYGVTIIAFVGSVFSPYYAFDGYQNPENHNAINVCLYRRRGHRWSMRERGSCDLLRSKDHFICGPSRIDIIGKKLVVQIDEIAAPLPRPLKGTITLTADNIYQTIYNLDRQGKHFWRPIAPLATVTVDMNSPNMKWSGSGYLDSNWGSEPLKNGFTFWNWSRAHNEDHAIILYDMARRDCTHNILSLCFKPDGSLDTFTPPPRQSLKKGFWGMERSTQTDKNSCAELVETLEDAPFYTRNKLKISLFGKQMMAMHESVDLDRHKHPIILLMLPWRMPRKWALGLMGQALAGILYLRRWLKGAK